MDYLNKRFEPSGRQRKLRLHSRVENGRSTAAVKASHDRADILSLPPFDVRCRVLIIFAMDTIANADGTIIYEGGTSGVITSDDFFYSYGSDGESGIRQLERLGGKLIFTSTLLCRFLSSFFPGCRTSSVNVFSKEGPHFRPAVSTN